MVFCEDLPFKRVAISAACLFAALLSCTLLPGELLAAETELTPSLEVIEEYNDNIFLDPEGAESDFITTVSPRLDFSRKSETSEFALKARADFFEYGDNSDYSDVDQKYDGEWALRWTPRLMTSLNAGFFRDHRPDRDLADSGLIFGTERRDSRTAGGSANYALTETGRLVSGYAYDSDDYESNENQDSDIHNVYAGYEWDFVPQLTPGVFIAYSYADYDTARLDIYSLQASLEASLAELWKLELGLGVRYSASEFDLYDYSVMPSGKRVENNDDFGGLVLINLRYDGERTKAGVGIKHDLQLATGQTGATMQTSFTFYATRRFTADLSTFVRGGYYLQESDPQEFADEEVDYRTASIGTGLRWELDRNWAVSLEYHYLRAENRVTDTDGDRNQVIARLTYRLPLLD